MIEEREKFSGFIFEMESKKIKEMRNGGESDVGGGVEDVYGEDRATEDQLVTPWTVSVAR